MTSLIIAAFIMGTVGSVHCIGMCGPLALSLPVVADSHQSRFFSTLLYNLGRALTYSLLGALFGIIGMSFAFFGLQQGLSIFLGIAILVFIILPKQLRFFKKNNTVLLFFEKSRAALSVLLFRKNYRSVFFIGILNGLLPCGLVYIAIIAAVSTGSVLQSSLFMLAFGLGTFPVMWSLSFFGSYINMNFRHSIKKLYPYLMFCMAVLLIVRGLGLHVSYMSPAISHEKKIEKQSIECHDRTQQND